METINIGQQIIEAYSEIFQGMFSGDVSIILDSLFNMFWLTAVICLFVGFILFILFIVLLPVIMLWGILRFFIDGVAAFFLAKKTGYETPYFGFIPLLQDFLYITIPKDELSMFFVKFKDRKGFAYVWLAIEVAVYASLYSLPVLGPLIYLLWLVGDSKIRYDFLNLFIKSIPPAVTVIIGIFIPTVYTIMLYVCLGKTKKSVV
jgi:hypothetical protein